MSALLFGNKMNSGYGQTRILFDCTIQLQANEIIVIAGPNGAGKSTAMRTLLGMLPLQSGSVYLSGEDISTLSTHQRVLKGLAFVPQNNNVFPSLTVRENLEMGGAFLHRQALARSLDTVHALFPILAECSSKPAQFLSGGQRQQLAFARALMSAPKILLLDEPTAGVSPMVMHNLFAKIREIAHSGVSVLVVEQNARQALEIADRGYILLQGRNAYSDSAPALLNNPNVIQSFLGNSSKHSTLS